MFKNLEVNSQIIEFLIKILPPAMVGLAIKIAVTMDKEKITIFNVVLSFITGIGFVFLLKYPIQHYAPQDMQPVLYGITAMSGEYIGKIIISIFRVDIRIKIIIEYIEELITNLLGMGRVFKNLISTVIGGGLLFAGIKMEFSDWIRVFFVMIGIIMIFSKDTLFSRLGTMLDSATSFLGGKKSQE